MVVFIKIGRAFWQDIEIKNKSGLIFGPINIELVIFHFKDNSNIVKFQVFSQNIHNILHSEQSGVI